jgi:hypothetical protein
MSTRDWREAAEKELRRAGVTAWRFEIGGKHLHLRYEFRGQSYLFVMPASPSDSRRGLLNAMSDLRRKLGLKVDAPPRSSRPKAKRAPPRQLSPMEGLTERPDPFAVLRSLLKD